MKDLLALLMLLVYNILVIGGLGYVVFFMGASGWWFLLLPIVVMRDVKVNSK